jgi:hypothetical protein
LWFGFRYVRSLFIGKAYISKGGEYVRAAQV